MSSRPILTPMPVIVNGDMSGNITSSPTVITNISMFSYSITWSGTSPVGTITAQVSNDYVPATGGNPGVAGTWNTLPLSATGTVSGNSGQGFIDIDQCGAKAVRIVYTRGSGTGSMNAVISGKVA